MKAFSFSSILKNFGKQLSSLASQMPWCNLRFNLGSISVLSRVSGPFSRTSLSASSGTSFSTSRRASHFAAMIFAVLVLSMANIGMAWGAINSTTVTKAGSSQKYIDVKTTAASNGDEVTEAKQYIAYTINDLISDAIKNVWYTQSSGGSGSSNTDDVLIPGYRAKCNKYIGISSSKKYTHYVTNCVSFSALYDPCGSSRYCTITATNVDDAEDFLTITNSGTVSSGNKYNVELTGLAESKYYRVVVNTNNSSESRIYQIRLGAPDGGVTKPSFSPATGSSLVKSTGTVTLTSSGNTVYYKWSQTDNQYASGAGATLADAADGSGTSPVNATAPSTAGTWYCYAVAKNGGDYSDVVKATYTITNPTHTLTWNLDGGTATGGTAAGAVVEGATLTAPTVTKVGYDFAGWSPSVPATMPAADATYTATWTKVYASGTYNFYNNATLGTAPNQKTITTSYADYDAFRIDNIFFSAVNMAYESGSTATGSDYAGWKIKKNNATIKFFVENDSKVTISVGRDNTLNVSYTNTAGATQTPTITSGNSSTYSVKGGTMVTLTMSTSSTITIKQIVITDIASCTAPESVTIGGAWDKFGGETISLTATATGGSGNYTYQWQKYYGSTWNNITDNATATTANLVYENCDGSHSGTYRCVVSTGTDCSTASGDLQVKVYTLKCYTNGTNIYHFTRNGNTQSGTLTLNLNANTTYDFKVHVDNDYYGNNGTVYENATNWVCATTQASNLKVFSGYGGAFTFTIDYSTSGNSNVLGEPELSVTYPENKTIYVIPNGYTSDNAKLAIYYWNDGTSGWSSFLTKDACSGDAYYAEIPSWTGKISIVRLNSDATVGDWEKKWNQTEDIIIDPTKDQYTVNTWCSGEGCKETVNEGTYTPATYSITFNGNGNTDGSMENVTGITCGEDRTLAENDFARTGYTFAGWATSADGEKVYNDQATISNITSDITLYAKWTVDSYTVTWKPAGGNWAGNTDNIVQTYEYGAKINAPEKPSRTGYEFVEWNPTYVVNETTMPANDVTYTATWTAKTTTITINANTANHGSTAPLPITATYGSALPSFTAATGASDYSLIGYFTAATSGTKVINADGTLVASTDYADGSGKWKSEDATLTLFAQYEEDASGGDCKELFVCTATSATACTATTGSAEYNIAGSGGGSCSIGGYSYYIKPNSSNVIVASPLEDKSFAAGDSLIFVVYNPNATAKTMGFVLASSTTEYTHEVAAGKLHYFRLKLEAADISNGKVTFNRSSGDDRWIGVTIKHCETASCSTPSAPTAFSNTAVTSTTATFSITDAGDAASYEIYTSTSSSTPTSETGTSVNSKTPTITGLTASTTYYAWVRSVCDADHKSAWVAGSSFTTSAAPAELTAIEANVLYQPLNMLCTGMSPLPSSDTYFTDDAYSTDNRFYYDVSSGNGPKAHTISSVTLGSGQAYEATFTSEMWVKGTSTVTDGIPSAPSIKFLTPSTSGTLYLYIESSSCPVKFKKEDGTASNITGLTQVVSGKIYSTTVDANSVYYIYGAGTSNTGFYGLKFVETSCTTPTTAFANGEYTVGGSALDLSTLFTSNSNGAVTYTVTNANGTGATIASTSFTATSAGTATVTAIQAADGDYCEKVMDATITVNAAPITPDPSGEPIITNTLATGTVTWGSSISTTDATNITNLTELAATGLTIDGNGNTNNGGQTAKITGTETNKNVEKYMSLGFRVACGKKLVVSEIEIPVQPVTSNTNNFEAVLTDGTTTITGTINNVTNGNLQNITFNSYGELVGNVTLKLYAWGWTQGYRLGQAVKIYGTIEEGDTPAATITWNTQPANGQVGDADFAYAVSCSDGSAVTVTSANDAVATIVDGKLHYVAEGTTHLVATATDACGNTITQNSNEFTVTAASVDPDPEPEPSGCITITDFDGTQNTSANGKPDANAKYLYGYTDANKTPEYAYTITTNKSNNVGKNDGAELYLYYGTSVNIYADNTTTGGTPQDFSGITYISIDVKMVKSSYYSSFDIKVGDKVIADDISLEGTAQSNYVTFEYNVSNLDGKVTIIANGLSTNHHIYVDNIKICTAALPSCNTPVLSDLEDQKVCPGSNVEWTANNTASLQDGETIAYQWTKKGNATILSPTATLTLTGITEAAGGTYVVTAIVSADGKASKTASKEVTLTVRPATATPTITANANTIYKGNSVTLTATCASSGVGYQWYTCNDAEGNGESEIGGAENAEYTFTAGEAGTYYYKVIVTGDGTHSCGTAEKVYALVVSAAIDASDCTTYFWFPYAQDATSNDVTNNENNFFGNSPKTGQNNTGTYKFELDGTTYTATKNTADANFTISFTIPDNSIGTMAINCKGSSSKPLYLKHTDDTQMLVSDLSSYKSFVIENITPGTWTLQSGGNWTLSGMAVKVCSGSTCTDPEVIATVDNATVCEDTENVTFTATNYADGATFQWQKKNGNTWENISEANSATYTISSVTTEHAGQYRVIATNDCSRTSEELTLTVLTAPEFNAFANTASVMKGNALTINDVEATNATDYTWYKSADNSFDVAADTKVGTSEDLLLAASSITEEADQTFYLFCVASNSCGSVTSNAITVTVTPFIEEECATKGNEGEHEFGFTNTSCSEDTYGDSKTPVWKTSSRSKYLTYTAPEGKYFATAKVTVAHTGGTKCGYAYSTNGDTTWVVAELGGLSATLTAITIELPANVNAFRISRNLTAQDGEKGSTSGNFYLAEACFTYENACTETTLTPDQETKTYNITDGGDFTKPTFTLKAGETPLENQTLTYTSSNPAIATVDEDGSVTFEGMTGTVTITAAYAGATIDEIEYCASEGSYTITVLCEDEEPKIIVAAGTNLDGCNNSITLEAKMQNDNSFTGGTYQWYRDGEAIEGATSASYTVVRAGTYTVSRTYTCTTMSSNSAVVTNENPEPKVERLTPFQYYHVDKDYSNQMKDRHLFAVTSYGTLDGKRYHLTATRNGETLDLSSSTAFFTISSSDNAVDTVMIDLNELKGKYSANDEIVITCAPINNCNQVSAITSSITIHVIDQTPTLALICSGANGDGTRKTSELTVGGDFLTGYNKADLCQQTGNTSFDPNTEWGFYTELQKEYIVTPVNGYAQFNKLNYEPFDILLLTDYPKSSKSEAAQKIIDDMAELCDYRPLLSFKTHFQSDKWKDKTTGEYKYTKWVKKGFTTAPVVPKQTATYVNIVCYAHPMFEDIDDINDQYTFHDNDDPNQLVYQVLRGPGYEGSKGIQGFELADADNFVTIGLVHYNAIADSVTHDGHTHISWNAEANDRLLVAMAERQTNIEARMMLFSLNCGAQSLQTPGGRNVILQCLKYLLETDPLKVADCRFTFDNGAGNTDFDPENYEGTGVKGDGLWSTAANWGPDYIVVPGRNNDVRIAAPCIVDGVKTKVSAGDEVQETIQYYPEVLSIHITENGRLTIPANSSLTARSTILRADENGNVYPTNVADISLGSNADGNASLILNNERGDTKAGVAMYSKAKAGTGTTWQYIGTPHSDVSNATYNYYDSWIYRWNPSAGWEVVPTGGAVYPWVGYCITHPELGHTYWMEGTLVETTTQEIEVPSNSYQIIGNSWTAPIQIANFEETDFDGIETKTIYFFNTGSDPEGDNSLTPNATAEARWAPGTYIPVPIHSAEYIGEDTEIPSMQGFYVANNNPTSAGTLHLDYERHVRAPRKNTPSGPMHAPARINAKDDEPIVAKLLVCGKRYDDKLILLEREDFTGGYDSGWDGDKWDGGTISPTIWAVNEIGGADAVAAIPEFEGTVIGFRAGEDNIYTIHFDYDGMEEALYLLDTETKIYTRVLKGNSYTFACPDKAEHNRFILTRKAPQIATGTENIATGENAKAVKFIKDDKIFIFVNGILYDATGKMVVR